MSEKPTRITGTIKGTWAPGETLTVIVNRIDGTVRLKEEPKWTSES